MGELIEFLRLFQESYKVFRGGLRIILGEIENFSSVMVEDFS